MNVLIDHHHTELTHSLELLFGKRLGAKVYYPIGREWFDRGYWKIYPHPATVEQYLGMQQVDASVHGRPEVETGSGREPVDPDVHYIRASTKPHYERAITFETFLKKPIGLVVASIPLHVKAFGEMIRVHKPGAKLIFQMGNNFPEYDLKGARNFLNSTDRRPPLFANAVRYSQEFDLKLFAYTPPVHGGKVTSFTHFMPQPEFFADVARRLPECRFEAYGAGNEHGTLTGTSLVAQKMREADFIWHLKRLDDGYGHVLHNAASMGRPVIISCRHYRKLRFGRFLEDGKTCVSLDGLSAEKLAAKIRRFREPERLEKMSRAIHERFRELVDFDRDEKNIRRFLARLK